MGASTNGCVGSICAVFKGGGDVDTELFEGRIVGRGVFVASCGEAEGKMVVDAMGTCVLFEGHGELELERFNSGMAD
jgi:hypothetical protein